MSSSDFLPCPTELIYPFFYDRVSPGMDLDDFSLSNEVPSTLWERGVEGFGWSPYAGTPVFPCSYIAEQLLDPSPDEFDQVENGYTLRVCKTKYSSTPDYLNSKVFWNKDYLPSRERSMIRSYDTYAAAPSNVLPAVTVFNGGYKLIYCRNFSKSPDTISSRRIAEILISPMPADSLDYDKDAHCWVNNQLYYGVDHGVFGCGSISMPIPDGFTGTGPIGANDFVLLARDSQMNDPEDPNYWQIGSLKHGGPVRMSVGGISPTGCLLTVKIARGVGFFPYDTGYAATPETVHCRWKQLSECLGSGDTHGTWVFDVGGPFIDPYYPPFTLPVSGGQSIELADDAELAVGLGKDVYMRVIWPNTPTDTLQMWPKYGNANTNPSGGCKSRGLIYRPVLA